MNASAENRFRRVWEPAGAPMGGVLLLHGVESHAGWFERVGKALAERGWRAHAYDRPGWGRSAGPRGAMASYADALADVARETETLRTALGGDGPVVLAGLSWGGILALYAALRRTFLFDGLTLVAPGLASKKDVGWLNRARGAWALARRRDETTSVPLAPRPEDFSATEAGRAFVRDDPLRVRAVTARFCVETLKMRRFLAETAGRRVLPFPAACLLAGHDAIMDLPRAEALCRRAGLSVATVPEAAHSLVLDHPVLVAAAIDETGRAALERRAARPVARAVVVGAGAVGTWTAGLLAHGGVATTLLARPAARDAIMAGGLGLAGPDGARVWPVDGRRLAVCAAGDAPPEGEPPDLALVAVKSRDTARAAVDLRAWLGPDTVVASLQNGMRNEAELMRAFPRRPLAAGAVCAYLDLAAPGRVAWADDRGGVIAAPAAGDPARVREAWRRVMPRAGVECRWHVSADAVKWSKLTLNVAFNALNALTGLSAAAILADPELGGLAARALREAFAVMRARRVPPAALPGYPVPLLALLARGPAEGLRRALARGARRETGGASSMRQDVRRGRGAVELDELNGYIVEKAEMAGVPAPANAEIVRRLRAAEDAAKDKDA